MSNIAEVDIRSLLAHTVDTAAGRGQKLRRSGIVRRCGGSFAWDWALRLWTEVRLGVGVEEDPGLQEGKFEDIGVCNIKRVDNTADLMTKYSAMSAPLWASEARMRRGGR